AAHHAGVREEAGVAMPQAGAGAVQMNIETKEGLFALMEQIAEEREAARPIVEQLATSDPPPEDIEIPEEWRTAGMVLELCEKANSKNESDPRLSLLLAQIALPVSVQVKNAWISKYLEARAWNEAGYANRYLCTLSEALKSYSMSERMFAETGLVYGVIRSKFLQSAVFFRAGQYDECSAINKAVRPAFGEFGDNHQLIKCDVLRSMVSLFQGQPAAARDNCQRLITELADTEDLHTLGVTYQCLGDAHRTLHEFNEAVNAFAQAHRIFSTLEMPGEINRAEFGIAN